MNTIAIMPTASGLTMSLPGKDKPIALSASHKNYEEILEILRSGTGEEQAAQILELLEGPARKLEEALRDSELSETVHVKDGVVTYKGKPLDNYVTKKILEFLRAGFPVSPVVKFLEKLMQNPIPRVVNRLYQFLEHGSIPLTPEGDFVAYKVVRENFLDKHSGTMDNSPGQVVKMERWEVDDNENNTCSSGLHVCSYEYVHVFGGTGDRLVACLVNPINVVSIPTDYNNTKMRVCEYTVLREIPEFHEKYKIKDVLAANPVFDESRESGARFVVRIKCLSSLSYEDYVDYFDNLVEAAETFEELVEVDSMELRDIVDRAFEDGLGGSFQISLVNTESDTVVEVRNLHLDGDEHIDHEDGGDPGEDKDYPFYVVTESGESEGFDSMLGALALSKEYAAEGMTGSIQNAQGAVLRHF